MRSRATGAVWTFVVLGALVSALVYGAAFLITEMSRPERASSGPSMVGGMGDASGRRGSGGGVR